VKGLSQALRDHPMLSACLVKRMYSFGVGGPVSMSTDRQILAYLRERFTEHGYKVPDLLREIALSNAFSQVREPKPAKPAATMVQADSQPAHPIAANNH
jgi:Protein of unknown function (DUF1585)